MKNIIRIHSGDAAVIKSDDWVIAEDVHDTPDPHDVLPMAVWLARVEQGEEVTPAVWIGVNDDPMELQSVIDKLSFIGVFFEDFKDGRGYSTAYLLRKRLNYQGDLRAFGDVLRDQLSLMRQCGFDSFAIKEGKDPYDAMKGIKGLSVTYSSSVSQPNPLYKRVRR